MPSIAIAWFRRDLRVHDHPALHHAIESADAVVPVFVLDPALLSGRWRSANRRWFLAAALRGLDAELRARSAELVVVEGDPVTRIRAVARELGAARVVATRDLAPYGRARDDGVRASLAGDGIEFDAGRGLLVHEPEDVGRADGSAFRVFSPFHRRWAALPPRSVLPAPDSLPFPEAHVSRIAGRIDAAGVAAAIGGTTPTADRALLLEPSEAAARARLDAWAHGRALDEYETGRDRLDVDGTSRLSQDLRWGLLSPVDVLDRTAGPGTGRAHFRTEIAWRDFYAHLLWHEPRVAREAFRREVAGIAWDADPAAIAAWKEGRTGYPVVDAAMRQLLATGWMHNRARMIVASFLTKHLGVDWRVGEAHFMEHLLDGDPASNNGGWQWAASTGTDPQPWFRIFNPTLQGRRHDPEGAYVRRWVPELAARTDLVGGDVHEPPPGAYHPPIVDHAEARRRALARYESAVSHSG